MKTKIFIVIITNLFLFLSIKASLGQDVDPITGEANTTTSSIQNQILQEKKTQTTKIEKNTEKQIDSVIAEVERYERQKKREEAKKADSLLVIRSKNLMLAQKADYQTKIAKLRDSIVAKILWLNTTLPQKYSEIGVEQRYVDEIGQSVKKLTDKVDTMEIKTRLIAESYPFVGDFQLEIPQAEKSELNYLLEERQKTKAEYLQLTEKLTILNRMVENQNKLFVEFEEEFTRIEPEKTQKELEEQKKKLEKFKRIYVGLSAIEEKYKESGALEEDARGKIQNEIQRLFVTEDWDFRLPPRGTNKDMIDAAREEAKRKAQAL